MQSQHKRLTGIMVELNLAGFQHIREYCLLVNNALSSCIYKQLKDQSKT